MLPTIILLHQILPNEKFLGKSYNHINITKGVDAHITNLQRTTHIIVNIYHNDYLW